MKTFSRWCMFGSATQFCQTSATQTLEPSKRLQEVCVGATTSALQHRVLQGRSKGSIPHHCARALPCRGFDSKGCFGRVS